MLKALTRSRYTQAALSACVFMSLCAGSAMAQDRIPPDVLQRMDRMEQELNTLNAAIYRDGAKPDPTAMAGPNTAQLNDINTRLDGFERQLRELTGQIEEAGFKAQQAEEKATKLQANMDMRLRALESGAAGSVSPNAGMTGGNTAIIDGGAPPAPVAPNNGVDTSGTTGTGNLPMPSDPNAPADEASSPTVKPLGEITASGSASSQDAANLYETAYAQLKQGNTAQAQSQFANFMKAYPDHPLAANASYWYAETYYTDKDYTNAARLFAESYQKFPKGSKAADSVLKLGLSLAESGKPQDACIALKQLDRSYKDADPEVLSRAKAEQAKLACK